MRFINKKFTSIFVLVVLTVTLGITAVFINQRVGFKGKAAGNGVTLSLSSTATGTTVNSGSNFDVNVLINNAVSANKLTAATVGLTYSSAQLSLVSVTPGTYFKSAYVAGSREMLSLGTTCTQLSDCGTTATGVSCTTGLCTNAGFTGNVTDSVKFSLGVPCDVTHMGCLSNTCKVLAGAGTDGCTTDANCAGIAGSGTVGQCYPQTTLAGTVATVRFLVKTGAPGGASSIGFDAVNSAVTALDASGVAIATNVLDTAVLSPISVTVGSTADNQAPTVPAGLTITGTTATSVSLSWTASTDNVGVTAYDIYRNSVLAGSVAGTITSYTSSGLAAGTYSFYVKARDAAGNASAASLTVTANLSAPAPTLTFGFKLLWSGGTTTSRTVTVTLKGATQTLAFTNIPMAVTTSGVFSPATPITLTGVTTGTTYSILVKVNGYLQKNLGTVTIANGANAGSAAWNSILPKAGDFDNNNTLNALDIGNILGLYTAISVPVTTATAAYDLDGNGVINALDVANTLASYTAISVPGDN